MKKTLNIDEHLLCEARRAVNAKSDTETVRLGLEALIQRAAQRRMRKLMGTMPEIQEVPRLRYEVPSE